MEQVMKNYSVDIYYLMRLKSNAIVNKHLDRWNPNKKQWKNDEGNLGQVI